MDALRASGVSYTRMLRSLIPVACLLWLSLSYASVVLMPQGQMEFYNILAKVFAMKGKVAFSPQRFSQGFDGITVYVDGEDNKGVYQGVILEDNRQGISVIYTAESAQFKMNGNHLELNMSDGVRFEGSGDDQRILSFNEYRVMIPVSSGKIQHYTSNSHVTLMTLKELWHELDKGEAIAVAEWNRRLLLPTTVLVLFFFALPFSLTQKRSGKAGSMIAGIAVLVVIYNLQLMLHRQVSQGAFPGWTMWAEQGVLLALGIYLWKRAEADRLPKVFSQTGEWIYLSHQFLMHQIALRREKS